MTTGRVSDVELMRGDRRASLRASLLSRSRASASSLGGGLDDEIPAFDDQVARCMYACMYICLCVRCVVTAAIVYERTLV